MRIIAGKARGTQLRMVPGKHVRPTADRVKESVFAVIGPFFDGGAVLDLFAGTGALGLEALSRGAERALFVDQSRQSLDTVRANAEATRLADRIKLWRKDARAALRSLRVRGERFRFIFLDPPYHEELLMPVLTLIGEGGLLDADGVVVAEHPTRLALPDEIGALMRFRILEYGDTAVSLYGNLQQDEGGSA